MAITPVPNGHLIKKDGTSLKNGGKVDAFKKIKKSIKDNIRSPFTDDRKENWMDKQKKKLSKVQPLKKKR